VKRVIFYIEPTWAFGSIHYELCKYLWPHGINAHLLPWNIHYSEKELNDLLEGVNCLVTTPAGVHYLRLRGIQGYRDKLVVVVHGASEISFYKEHFNITECLSWKGFYALSDFLIKETKSAGIPREPLRLQLGINYFNYFAPVSTSLNTLGYAGTGVTPTYNAELKRYYLVQEIAIKANKPLLAAQTYINSFINMPGYYRQVDAVLITSTKEGAGLPALEAGAAGRLVLSTSVGHWDERCTGITLPMDDDALVKTALQQLNVYEDPALYRQKCMEIQEHARSYDWSNVIFKWIEALE
jgi:glycosyltransferase involved in cell wall biosynthesis